MKWPVMLLLAAIALGTATAFKLTMLPTAATAMEASQNFALQKKLAIRCSPNYIPGGDEVIPPLTGWGNYKWKITTTSDSAQFYFNQGMAMYYAFHIIEARASFDRATDFDATCAMAWWGKALAFGPNINDFGYQRPTQTLAAISKAIDLQASGTVLEKALIKAIAVRYSADTTIDQHLLNRHYKDAMHRVYKQFGKNADVASLYADALMLLHPWDLYNHDFSPREWTPEIVATIKRALKLAPHHPGANHYFIHAVEASAKPGDALKSAKLLASAMPGVSHITHMPSHIYIRTGYYNTGIQVNAKANKGYKKYLAAFSPTAEGTALYLLHNLHMQMACAQMAGNYEQSLAAAEALQNEIPPFYLSMGGALGNYVQYLHQSPLITHIRFGKWDEVLRNKVNDTLAFTGVLQHFGRGLAYTKKEQLHLATQELAALKNKMTKAVLKEPLAPFNAAYDAAVIAQKILEGMMAARQKNFVQAINFLQEAVAAEDRLIYNEPRDWLLPARHYLADVLLTAGEYNKAIAVLRKDLEINPQNGWDLTGLQIAFTNLKKTKELAGIKQRIKNAWLIKDLPIDRPVF